MRHNATRAGADVGWTTVQCWLPILYVLQTGCAWAALPSSFGVSCPTAHRRFTEWVESNVFTRLHQELLDLLGSAGAIDWSRASVDSTSARSGGPD